MKKNILVAHGGGPTPVMNSSLQGVIEGARSYMIPAVKEFVREIDTAAGVVRVHLIEGMATDEN